MCGRISPLGVCVRFGTMQVAGCRSRLALDGGFGRLASLSSIDNLVYDRRPSARFMFYSPIRDLSPLRAALSASGTVFPAVSFFLDFLTNSSIANFHFPRCARVLVRVLPFELLPRPEGVCFVRRGLSFVIRLVVKVLFRQCGHIIFNSRVSFILWPHCPYVFCGQFLVN